MICGILYNNVPSISPFGYLIFAMRYEHYTGLVVTIQFWTNQIHRYLKLINNIFIYGFRL